MHSEQFERHKNHFKYYFKFDGNSYLLDELMENQQGSNAGRKLNIQLLKRLISCNKYW